MNAMVEELAADRAAPGLLGLAERGLLPDVLIRAGIRRLCAQRLRDETAGGQQAQSALLAQRLRALRQGALAVHTDAANRQHYELPADFFRHCLGHRLKYSSCYYPTGTETLDQAEDAMLALYGERAALADGQDILELGCGAGQDAELMTAAGFEVTPTDGSAGLAAEAEARLGRPVRVMRFEELDETAAYDGVWANACLLHVPEDGLADVLARIHRALKPGGRFHTGFKAGDGGGRDSLGRYYNFPDEARLRAAYGAAGDWAALTITPGKGGGFDGVMRDWLFVDAVKG